MTQLFRQVPVTEKPEKEGHYITLRGDESLWSDYIASTGKWEDGLGNERFGIQSWFKPLPLLNKLTDEEIEQKAFDHIAIYAEDYEFDNQLIKAVKDGAEFARTHYETLLAQQQQEIDELNRLLKNRAY